MEALAYPSCIPLSPTHIMAKCLASQFGLCARTTRMSRIGMAGELDDLAGFEVERILESLAHSHEDVAASLGGATFPAGCVAVATAREWLADALCPEANAVEALPHVDHNAHDFPIIFVLECLADGGEHDVQPEVVYVDGFLVFELKCPFSTVLVLEVLPFGPNTGLEEMVVGLDSEFGGWRNVVLCSVLASIMVEGF
jgi:hypothetical protein